MKLPNPFLSLRPYELHPLAALFGILAGAEVAGVIGVYLSIPIMASRRIVWRHWRTYMDAPVQVVPTEDVLVPPGGGTT